MGSISRPAGRRLVGLALAALAAAAAARAGTDARLVLIAGAAQFCRTPDYPWDSRTAACARWQRRLLRMTRARPWLIFRHGLRAACPWKKESPD